MNFEIDELQKIAQNLDDFMRDYGNSTALDVAADAIATELEDRDTTVSEVLVTANYLVDVKHKRSADEEDVLATATDYITQEDHHLMYAVAEVRKTDIETMHDVELDS